MRTVIVKIEMKITMVVDEGQEITEVLDVMDCDFADNTGNATIMDTEILDHEIIDSK